MNPATRRPGGPDDLAPVFPREPVLEEETGMGFGGNPGDLRGAHTIRT